MFETITQFSSYLEKVSFLTYPVAMFLGFLSGATALTCLMPLVPAIAGFIGTQDSSRKKLFTVPLFIMLGSVVTLVILGVIVSWAGLTIQKTLGQHWSYFIGSVCILVGLFVLGLVNLPARIKIPTIKQKGFIGPFLFGLCAGGVMGFGSSCCIPVLPVVLTYAAVHGKPVHGGLIMASFAIGQSLPLFAIGLFSNVLVKFTSKWSGYVRRIAGGLLLISGIYFIWKG